MGKQSAAIGAALRKTVAQAAKALILEVDAELRKNPSRGGTPVDTGHARANWVPSIAIPHTGEVQGDAAHAEGVGKVMSYKLEQGALWLANGVPYIQRLNYGHSKQAPALFVEVAVGRALDTIRGRYASKGIDLGSSAGLADDLGGQMAGNLASAYNPLGGDE